MAVEAKRRVESGLKSNAIVEQGDSFMDRVSLMETEVELPGVVLVKGSSRTCTKSPE